MTKQILTILLAISGIAQGCSKKNADKEVTNCFNAEINHFKTMSHCDDASVEKYTFQGKTVYVFEPGTCGNDMAAPVIDENCNNLGSLGGFGGNIMINGENFSSAVFVETVWQK